jgi:hypothetical protein
VSFRGSGKSQQASTQPVIRSALPVRNATATVRGRDPIILADLMPIAAAFDWRKQRRLWRRLVPD